MNVDSIMTKSVVTVSPDDLIRSAIERLEDQDVRHLPVVRDGVLVGIVTDRDLREYRLPVLEELRNPDYADRLQTAKVEEVMNPTVIWVEPDEALRNVVGLMIEYGVGAIPVVQGHTKELVGIVSYVDVLRAVRTTL